MKHFPLLLKLLHFFPPEAAHHIAIYMLKCFPVKNILSDISLDEFNQTCMGLTFSHPIGFAAGFDKNAEVFHKLGMLGFSSVEVGTITPKPQPGNPKPRIFRLPEKEAIINAYGFNSKGMNYAKNSLRKYHPTSILGINLGINKNTLDPRQDFLQAAELLIQHADYFTINVSSPNTPGLRDMQNPETLKPLLEAIKNLMQQKNKIIPLLVKLSPDIPLEEETRLITFLVETKVDGIIISNTTITRPGLEYTLWNSVKGGLSGPPLKFSSTVMLKRAYGITQGKIPLIGCGGINSGQDAFEKFCAGANLLQLYTAFIYKGPLVLRQILTELKNIFAEKNIKNISEIIGIHSQI